MRQETTEPLLREFMKRLGAAVRGPARVYLVGGATAVLHGWRDSTLDIDVGLEPDSPEMLRAITALRDDLDVNVELATPAQFIPELPGWRDRSPWIETVGRVHFHHYDPYSQALAKIERGHQQDAGDVARMLRDGLVEPQRAWDLFERIEPELFRFPGLDPIEFRRRVGAALGPR